MLLMLIPAQRALIAANLVKRIERRRRRRVDNRPARETAKVAPLRRLAEGAQRPEERAPDGATEYWFG